MIRINNISFNKATYLGEPPEHISYHINRWFPNEYYNKESEFTKVDSDFYCYPNNQNYKIHKDCFKNKECSYAIASFDYNSGIYELHFIGDRPIELPENELKDFWEVIKYGYKILNNGKQN